MITCSLCDMYTMYTFWWIIRCPWIIMYSSNTISCRLSAYCILHIVLNEQKRIMCIEIDPAFVFFLSDSENCIYIYVTPNPWNCPVHELGTYNAQLMNCAIGLPSTWPGQETYCSVHELCSACARKLFFHARLLEFFQKHNNVVNIVFWWCHITISCMECLFVCSEIH